jgi:hypothetical protein
MKGVELGAGRAHRTWSPSFIAFMRFFAAGTDGYQLGHRVRDVGREPSWFRTPSQAVVPARSKSSTLNCGLPPQQGETSRCCVPLTLTSFPLTTRESGSAFMSQYFGAIEQRLC